MSKKRNTKILAKRWFDRANNSWLFTQAGYKNTGITTDTCFGCQQVVEKYLKGFLVYNSTKPPRIHDLSKLLFECIKIDSDFKDFVEACDILTKYYTPTRYPMGIVKKYSKQEAEEALDTAERIIAFIRSKIEIYLT